MNFCLIESKSFRKKIALLLCISIVFNSVFLPLKVLAEEVSQAENPAPQQEPLPTPPDQQQSSPPPESSSTPETQSEQPPPTPSETPASTSEIQTGDAGSQSSSENTVNYNNTTTTGNVSPDGCSVETNIGCDPSTTNQSQTSAETEASSTSGVNTIEGAEGNAEIGTGEAVSQSTAENLLNTNIIEATGDTEIEEQNQELAVIELDNTAEHQATSSAESISGQNAIAGSTGNATIETGTSIAQTDQANIINTNVLGSNFEFFVLPIITDQNGDIDLNELWKQLQQKIAEESAGLNTSTNVLILNTNEAYVDLTAIASAVSGQNSVVDNGGIATIQTGDSIAAANIFNLINLNIVGSNFLFGVINIFGSLTGNIIVPSPYRFLEYLAQNNYFGQSDIVNQNFAYLTSNVTATADSGTNQQIDENGQSLETGDAYSYASSTNFANLNLLMSSWYFLLLNNFGFWDGTVDSWENPASSSPQQDPSVSYELGGPNEQTVEGQTTAEGGNTSVINNNSVEINANVSAEAISGQNLALRNLMSLIKTGKSIALASIFNFLNTNIVASNFFMPIINLFGSWRGNLVFAYPNLQVEMSADKEEVSYGDSLNYTVNYSNVGYEDARNVTLNIDLPQEAAILSAPGQKFSSTGKQLQFLVGDIAAKTSGSFSFSVTIQRPTSLNKSENFLTKLFSSLVKPVEAAENAKELLTTANIATPDPETDTLKNNTSVVTYLITPQNSDETTKPSSQENVGSTVVLDPRLEVTSSNNTGEFVYPGDIVTFFATVKNSGEGKAVNTVVYQDITYKGLTVVRNQFDLADIEGGKQKKLTFSIQIPKTAKAGLYESVIFADGLSTDSRLFTSNDSISQFAVKTNTASLPLEKTNDKGTVLAAGSDLVDSAKSKINWLYLLVFALTLLWYVEYVRRKDVEDELKLLLRKAKKAKDKA